MHGKRSKRHSSGINEYRSLLLPLRFPWSVSSFIIVYILLELNCSQYNNIIVYDYNLVMLFVLLKPKAESSMRMPTILFILLWLLCTLLSFIIICDCRAPFHRRLCTSNAFFCSIVFLVACLCSINAPWQRWTVLYHPLCLLSLSLKTNGFVSLTSTIPFTQFIFYYDLLSRFIPF